jgi:hypothetical protein
MTQPRLIINNTNYIMHRANLSESNLEHHNCTAVLQHDNPSLSCHLVIVPTLKQRKFGIPLGNTSLHNLHLCMIFFLMYVKRNIRIMFSRPSLKPPSLNYLLVGNLSHRNRKEITSISSTNSFTVSGRSTSAKVSPQRRLPLLYHLSCMTYSSVSHLGQGIPVQNLQNSSLLVT